MMAPTIAWLVETGSPRLVIIKTVAAAHNETANPPANASTAPKALRVWVVPLP